MKTLKILFGITLFALFFTSCEIEVNAFDNHVAPMSVYDTLESKELWYVAINETQGAGEVPFLQKAFTVSFRNGTLFANNNLVGIGSTGNGFGIDVGYYNAYQNTLEVSHDINGFWDLEVRILGYNKIELYSPYTHTSYYLYGYDRNTFDYDLVFYNNIHYFLQEYESWEKVGVYGGTANPFDNENFIQFLAGGNNREYRSSQDNTGTPINNIYWDYSGLYTVSNFVDTNYVKALTLDYDYFGDEYFEVTIINDGKIELYHPASNTIYEFVGRHFIQYLKTDTGKHIAKKRSKTVLKNFHKETVNRPKIDKAKR